MLTEETLESENIVRDISVFVAVSVAIYTVPKIGLKLLKKHRESQILSYNEFKANKENHTELYIPTEKDI